MRGRGGGPRLVCGMLAVWLLATVGLAQETDAEKAATRDYVVAQGFQKKRLYGDAVTRWKSFLTAFVIITVVMIVSLRSLSTGVVAMIPNLTPILLVFGVLGWAGWYVDIGMMMSGSIALGIAVDGTFHFLVRYHEHRRDGGTRHDSSREALGRTGPPILLAAIIAAAGMLALSLSPFLPTMRFGLLTAAMLVTALLGDLVLLPALLALGSRGRHEQGSSRDDSAAGSRKRTPHGVQRPHFVAIEEHRAGVKARRRSGRARGRGRTAPSESIPA